MSADVKKKLPLRSLRIIEEDPKALNAHDDKTINGEENGNNAD